MKKWVIQDQDYKQFVHSDIDSGGMSVCLTSREHADEFDSASEASRFLLRVRERYTVQRFQVVQQ